MHSKATFEAQGVNIADHSSPNVGSRGGGVRVGVVLSGIVELGVPVGVSVGAIVDVAVVSPSVVADGVFVGVGIGVEVLGL